MKHFEFVIRYETSDGCAAFFGATVSAPDYGTARSRVEDGLHHFRHGRITEFKEISAAEALKGAYLAL